MGGRFGRWVNRRVRVCARLNMNMNCNVLRVLHIIAYFAHFVHVLHFFSFLHIFNILCMCRVAHIHAPEMGKAI